MTSQPIITPEAREWAEIFMDAHRAVEDDRELLALAFMELQQKASTVAGGLTKTQADVLSFTGSFIAERGFSPNYSEIAQGVGLASKGRVCAIIGQLEERGFVRRTASRARSVALVGRA